MRRAHTCVCVYIPQPTTCTALPAGAHVPQGAAHPATPQFAANVIKFFNEQSRIPGLKFMLDLELNSEVPVALAVLEQSRVSEQIQALPAACPPDLPIIMPPCHPPPHQPVTLLPCHPVTLSSHHLANQQPTNLPTRQPTNLSTDQPGTDYPPTRQPANSPTCQPTHTATAAYCRGKGVRRAGASGSDRRKQANGIEGGS